MAMEPCASRSLVRIFRCRTPNPTDYRARRIFRNSPRYSSNSPVADRRCYFPDLSMATCHSLFRPAALAFFQRALAAAESLARQAALRCFLRPRRRGGAPTAVKLPRRPRRAVPLAKRGLARSRICPSSDSSLAMRSLMTTARRSCLTEISRGECMQCR